MAATSLDAAPIAPNGRGVTRSKTTTLLVPQWSNGWLKLSSKSNRCKPKQTNFAKKRRVCETNSKSCTLRSNTFVRSVCPLNECSLG